MNNPDHISWSLETIFWVKIVTKPSKIRDGDPGFQIKMDQHSPN
jgi:hypothetical protein